MIFEHGTIINQKYYILEELGHGGNGRVFLARDLILDKRWAIKFFKNSKKTEDEIGILKRLDHPMIPRIVEYIQYQTYTGVVMDYLKGVDISSICQSGYFFSISQTLKIGISICEVLSYLHQQNPPIIFRDLKPQNLMLTWNGQLKLIDFDCACLQGQENASQFVGTKGYAAPEQYHGVCNPGIDIYALGITLETICKKRKPAGVRKIFKKCRYKDPKMRYQKIDDVKAELERCLKSVLEHKKSGKLLASTMGLLVLLSMIQVLVLTGSEAACMEAVKEGRYEDAASMFPEREEIYLAMLQAGMEQGKTEDTIQIISQFQQMYPEETREHDTLCIKIGRLYMQGNVLDPTFGVDYEKAKSWYQRVPKEIYPEVTWSLEVLDSLTRSGTDISWEETADSMKNLSIVYRNEKTFDRKNLCEMLAAVWMTNRYYFSQCGERPIRESIQLLEEVVLIAQEQDLKNGTELQYSLAHAYYLEGILENNQESLKKSLELHRDLGEDEMLFQAAREKVLVKMIYLLEELNLYDEAAIQYQELIELYPDELEYLCSYALMELLHRQNEEKAREILESAKKISGAEQHQNYQILKERLEGLE